MPCVPEAQAEVVANRLREAVDAFEEEVEDVEALAAVDGVGPVIAGGRYVEDTGRVRIWTAVGHARDRVGQVEGDDRERRRDGADARIAVARETRAADCNWLRRRTLGQRYELGDQLAVDPDQDIADLEPAVGG